MRIKWTLTLGLILVLLLTGCSSKKKQQEEDTVDLRGRVAELEAKLNEAEAQHKELHALIDKAALQARQDKGQLQTLISAQETRLIHQPLDQFQISPAPPQIDGWLLVDGERSYTLQGHTGATQVHFYFADVVTLAPRFIGAATAGPEGWSWSGILPGGQGALWAEVQYTGDVVVKSAVLPIMPPGK